jgi:hypothetical protein
MPAGDVAADCEEAAMNTPPGGSGDVKLTADVVDGATVAPGDDILLRLTWDPKLWSGPELDRALTCVRLKGGLDPDLSAEEQPAANDGVFEYRLHVPDDIRPGCDICAQGFVAGAAADGGPQQVRSQRYCFMSGRPETPTPPATQPLTQPPPTPEVVAPVPAPAEVPTEVRGVTVSAPGSASAPAVGPSPPTELPRSLPAGELPRTGSAGGRTGSTAGGLALSLGGLAMMGGAGRRRRHRTEA